MQQYLRFLCYDDPSRQSSTQIHPDIAVDSPPKFKYGQPVTVGSDANDPATWPLYYIANLTRMKQINDPNQVEKSAMLFRVYLAREEQWPKFEVPQVVREIWEEEKRGTNR